MARDLVLNNFSTNLALPLLNVDSTIWLVGTDLTQAATENTNAGVFSKAILTIEEGGNIEIISVYGNPTVDGNGNESIAISARGIEGTSPLSFSTAAKVEMRLTASLAGRCLDSLANIGSRIPISVALRADSLAVSAGSFYLYSVYDSVFGYDIFFILECLQDGITAASPPALSHTDFETQITDGTAVFLALEFIPDYVTDHPTSGDHRLVYASEAAGVSSNNSALIAEGVGALGYESVALGGQACARRSISLGKVRNTVRDSVMQSGLPVIPSGFDAGLAYDDTGVMATKGGGSVAVLAMPTVDFKTVSTITEQLPIGSRFYVDEIGVIFDDSDGVIDTLPTVAFGNTDGGTELLSATLVTGSYASYSRKVYAPAIKDGCSILSASVTLAASGAGSLYGRFYFKGLFIAPEPKTKWLDVV